MDESVLMAWQTLATSALVSAWGDGAPDIHDTPPQVPRLVSCRFPEALGLRVSADGFC